MIPRSPRSTLVALGLTLLLAGCGDAEIAPPPVHDLGEPWQAQPFAVESEGSGSSSSTDGANGPQTTTSYTTGKAGANVAAVEILLASAGPLRASLNRGVYAAWWPNDDTMIGVRGFDGAGNLVGSSN